MKKPQALIVEDVSDLATIFTHALTAANYAVTCLADGLAAQRYLANHVPDLLLLDIFLPTLKGDALLKLVRQDERFAKTKIILVTADTRRGEELQDEVDFVLHKPVSYRQLRDLSSRLTAVMDHLHTKPFSPLLPTS